MRYQRISIGKLERNIFLYEKKSFLKEKSCSLFLVENNDCHKVASRNTCYYSLILVLKVLINNILHNFLWTKLFCFLRERVFYWCRISWKVTKFQLIRTTFIFCRWHASAGDYTVIIILYQKVHKVSLSEVISSNRGKYFFQAFLWESFRNIFFPLCFQSSCGANFKVGHKNLKIALNCCLESYTILRIGNKVCIKRPQIFSRHYIL